MFVLTLCAGDIRDFRHAPPYACAGLCLLRRSSNSALKVQSSQEPQHEEYDQHQAKDPAQPRPTVTTVPVVTTAAAEQQNEYDDYQDYTHVDTPGD